MSSNRKVHITSAIGFALTLVVLVLGGLLGYVNSRQLLEDRWWVAHTHEVIGELELLLSILKDAETGQRGYLLTENAIYLRPYDDALDRLQRHSSLLKELVSDNSGQLARLADLDRKIDVRLGELARTIELLKQGDRPAAIQIVHSDVGKTLMDEVRLDIAAMQQLEQDLLKKRAVDALASYRATIVSILLSSVIGIVLVTVVFYVSQREVRLRERTAEVVSELMERLRTTLSSIGDAVMSTDIEGDVTYMNPVAEELTGWTEADAKGKPLTNVFSIVNETTRKTVDNPALKALKEGIIVGLANHTVLIAKDKSERPIDDSAAPIRCRDGEIVGCVLVFRDVADRRRQEQELEVREQQFRMLADSIPQLAWMANPDGHIFWYNGRWFDYTGTTFEQMEGWGWQSVHDPKVLPKVIERWRSCITTGESFEMVFPLKHRDGVFRPFLTRVVPVKDLEGRVARWFGSCTDIFEQQQTQDTLRRLAADLSEADRRKDEFLATLAHELRNPLAPLRNGLQLLGLAGIDAATIEKARKIMERQLTQLVRLVDDLMDVSRISLGKIELRRGQLLLSSVINSAVETSRLLIEQMGHELTVTLPVQPVIIDADLTRLVQVFMNLLNNASKYTDSGGQILLAAEVELGDVIVTVRDNGIGLDADQLPRIFDMFSQVDNSLEKSHGGLGIGLTLVKRLVEMHGGRIEARSDGPGKGSEFIVRLPIVVLASQQKSITAEEQLSTIHSSIRILIVDDNRDGADSLSMVLKLMGNDICTAYDGEEALIASEEFRPDVVLLDIAMPKLNGYETCQRLREQPGGKRRVIIAQTGWGQDEDRQRTREAGFDHHLVKPVDPSALMKLLSGLSESASS